MELRVALNHVDRDALDLLRCDLGGRQCGLRPLLMHVQADRKRVRRLSPDDLVAHIDVVHAADRLQRLLIALENLHDPILFGLRNLSHNELLCMWSIRDASLSIKSRGDTC